MNFVGLPTDRVRTAAACGCGLAAHAHMAIFAHMATSPLARPMPTAQKIFNHVYHRHGAFGFLRGLPVTLLGTVLVSNASTIYETIVVPWTPTSLASWTTTAKELINAPGREDLQQLMMMVPEGPPHPKFGEWVSEVAQFPFQAVALRQITAAEYGERTALRNAWHVTRRGFLPFACAAAIPLASISGYSTFRNSVCDVFGVERSQCPSGEGHPAVITPQYAVCTALTLCVIVTADMVARCALFTLFMRAQLYNRQAVAGTSYADRGFKSVGTIVPRYGVRCLWRGWPFFTASAICCGAASSLW